MTPTVNRLELRSALAGLAEPARSACRDQFATMDLPKFTDEAWDDGDPATLLNVAEHLAAVAKRNGAELHIPLATDHIAALIAGLADDLADLAAAKCKAWADPVTGVTGVPNIKLPHLWTIAQWRAADAILAEMVELSGARHRKVMAALSSVGGNDTDELRHTLVGCVTNGRTTSSQKLTAPEAEHLIAWTDAVKIANAGAATFPPPTPYEPDWKVIAKRFGATQAALKTFVNDWLYAHHMAKVGKLSDTAGMDGLHRLTGAVFANDWTKAEEPAEMTTVVTEAPEPVDLFGEATARAREAMAAEAARNVAAAGLVPVTPPAEPTPAAEELAPVNAGLTEELEAALPVAAVTTEPAIGLPPVETFTDDELGVIPAADIAIPAGDVRQFAYAMARYDKLRGMFAQAGAALAEAASAIGIHGMRIDTPTEPVISE